MDYWKTITFKTRAEMNAFFERHKKTYSMYEVFIRNGYALNYKSLIKI